MKQLDRPLARRTLIKGTGLGLVAGGMADVLPARSRRGRLPIGRRRDLEQGILGQEG